MKAIRAASAILTGGASAVASYFLIPVLNPHAGDAPVTIFLVASCNAFIGWAMLASAVAGGEHVQDEGWKPMPPLERLKTIGTVIAVVLLLVVLSSFAPDPDTEGSIF